MATKKSKPAARKPAKVSKPAKGKTKPAAGERKARTGTKKERMIGLLRQPAGLTIEEAGKAMGWQPHTTRAFISATLGKKLGHKIETEKDEKRGRVYRIVA